ncbi:MAG: hypothetical protein LH603_11020 [Pseudonocardia sp.]|nr:hypothetical protein [Pseudonocardia sp.]
MGSVRRAVRFIRITGACLTGADNVEVVLAEGALGHPAAAPYDPVIATVGAFEIATAWLGQLAPDGRLVAPVRLAGAASRSIIFERDTDSWVSRGNELAMFMPLRGIGDDARRVLDLTGTGEVTLQTHKDNAHDSDPDTLAGVFDTPAHDVWTGVHFAPGESFEWLDLWLPCHLPNPLMRMEVAATACDRGLARPVFDTTAPATTSSDQALQTHDGYTARDVLRDSSYRDLPTAAQQRDLTARVERCGPHRSAIPATELTELTELTEHARPRRRRHHIRSHGATRIGHHASVKLPAPSLISLSMSRRHADASQNTL